MDNRLFLIALVVTLSWISLGTNAQNANSTISSGNNATAAGNNATAAGNNATAAGNNVTATGNNATAAGNNATAAGNNATTTGNNATTTGNNATTAAGNNATAVGNNATAAGNNATAAGNNATTTGNNATTTGNNATTAAGNNATTAGNNVTTAPPLTSVTAVEILVTPVSREQCGKQQLCAAQPSQCDPSTPGSCFFLAAKQINGNNFEFGLSGESNGYIAASLSPGTTTAVNATTYVCANNRGVVKFFGTLLNNGQLIPTQLNVNNIKGSVNGTKIQCTFAATVPTPRTKVGGFEVQIATGSFNSTSGLLGVPTAQLRSTVTDLANPNSTATNTLSINTTTTTSPNTSTTTNNAITLQQSMTQAMMITVAVLGLAML